MTKLIQTIQQLISRIFGQEPSPLNRKQALVKGLTQALEMTEEKELACGEVFEVIDQYAEALIRGDNVQDLEPLVHHHLQMCHECQQEFEMLLEMMRAETA